MDTGKINSWIDQAQPILAAFGLKALSANGVPVATRPVKIYPV